tara:strand:- start:1264 stop:1383 length:120 start_codon:yes stop_codon:yes gene_type:complete
MGAIGKELRRSKGLPLGQVGMEEEIQSFVPERKGCNKVV